MKVLYLCNGKNAACQKHDCYLNHGECKYTSNINNAKNFKSNLSTNDEIIMVEKEENITDKEKGFIITCIQMAIKEGLYDFPRYNEPYHQDSGIKYEVLTKTEIIDLLRKLGADENDLEELYDNFKFA